jgi:HlyD family secretion protein
MIWQSRMKHLPFLLSASTTEPHSQRKSWTSHFPRLTPRNIAYIAGVVALGLLLIWAFQPAPMQVDVGVVERGSLQVTVEAEGKTRESEPIAC